MGEASISLGPNRREVHFQISDDLRRNVLSLLAVVRDPIAQWVRAEDPIAPAYRMAWSFHFSHQTLAQASRSQDPGILFWNEMRREFGPITPTPTQAEVMRAYVLLWPRLFSTHPPNSVGLDLSQAGIFDVRILAGATSRGWGPRDDAIRVREAERAGIQERIFTREGIGRRIAQDTSDDPVKALAAPSSKLPVYRPV
jgi:hypothetical protein